MRVVCVSQAQALFFQRAVRPIFLSRRVHRTDIEKR